jgi:hypothetical protein
MKTGNRKGWSLVTKVAFGRLSDPSKMASEGDWQSGYR